MADVDLGTITVARRKELEDMLEKVKLMKKAGLDTLMGKSDMSNSPGRALSNALSAGDMDSAGIISQSDAINPMELGTRIGLGMSMGKSLAETTEKKKKETSIADTTTTGSGMLNKITKTGGNLLGDLLRGATEGFLGMPESKAGSSSSIPYTVGRLPGDLVRNKVGLPTSAEATTRSLSGKASVFSSMDTSEYSLLQQDLAKIPDELLKDMNTIMPLYRQLLMKYPSAKSFLSEYFGLTRNYNYNFPTGTPQGKYNISGPVIGATVGEE